MIRFLVSLALLTLGGPAVLAADSDYALGPDSQRQDGVPQGKVTKHHWTSKVFPGTERDYWVYVPAQYKADEPACLMVFQDGQNYVDENGQFRVPIVFDNLIYKGQMLATIGVFVNPGVIPPQGDKPRESNRSFEYDTLSDQYARLLLEEILPEVAKSYKITDDPAGRAIGGISSGGICAWTVAWQRPDSFRRVLSHVGSFTNIRGGHVYPALIRKTPRKPIKAFLQGGAGDLDNEHGNWPLANQEMASALHFASYDYKFEFGTGAHSGKHGGAILPESLRWLWNDWPQIGKFERLDPRFDELVPKDAAIERLADGYDWAEGPAWDRKHRYLVFSDIPPNLVIKWEPGLGSTVFLKPSGYTGAEARGGEPGSNGLAFDSAGRLVLCEHGDRRVARLETDGSKTTLADRFEGKRFNSPNDLAYSSAGDLFFTDPPYGLEGQNNDPKKELPFNGVYRLSKDGKLTLLTKEMSYPNGVALSPDERTLYVANSDPAKAIWMAFELKDDGTLGAGRVFADFTSQVGKAKGLPDGLKVDAHGNLFATGPGGVLVFSPDGKHLGTIATGEATANCGWGEDGSTLYITADMYLLRVKTATKGKGF